MLPSSTTSSLDSSSIISSSFSSSTSNSTSFSSRFSSIDSSSFSSKVSSSFSESLIFSSTASMLSDISSKLASSPIISKPEFILSFNSLMSWIVSSLRDLILSYSSLIVANSFLASLRIPLASSFAFSTISFPVSSAAFNVLISDDSTLLNFSFSVFCSDILFSKSIILLSKILNSLASIWR